MKEQFLLFQDIGIVGLSYGTPEIWYWKDVESYLNKLEKAMGIAMAWWETASAVLEIMGHLAKDLKEEKK